MAEYRYVGGIMENDAARLRLRRRYPPFARLPDGAMRTLGPRRLGGQVSFRLAAVLPLRQARIVGPECPSQGCRHTR